MGPWGHAYYTSDGGRAVPDDWLVPRLSFSTAWTDHTLRHAAMHIDSRVAGARRSLVRAIKRLR